MMGKQIFKFLMSGLILLMIMPFFLVGGFLTVLLAGLVGAPLTAPSPPVIRPRPRNEEPRIPEPYVGRGVSAAAQRMIETVS